MSHSLKINTGQYSDKGNKKINQDFYGIYMPKPPLLETKGIAIAIADGISSSEVSQIASETAVRSFFEDYYATPESWSVKTAAQRVLFALNSWLYSQTRQSPFRYYQDKGYVCTFSALIIKSTTAYIFHIGDARVYRIINNKLEQLTEDHRVFLSDEQNYLSRALGVNQQFEIDYTTIALEVGDIFVLATDGVYEYIKEALIIEIINQNQDNLNTAAEKIIKYAYQQGSPDNLTLQIIQIDQLPQQNIVELHQHITTLPFPPPLEPRMEFDGYKILQEIYISSRSHVYLVQDIETQKKVILKIPATESRENTLYLERFLIEEWVAQRINNPYILKHCLQTRKRHYLYLVTEYIKGQTLAQWMRDHPKPHIEIVRSLIAQIAKGLQAFHRQEMLHQDIRPENIMIDQDNIIKIIDFGSTQVAGLQEIMHPLKRHNILGTAQFTAPEYFLGETGTPNSDLFSLAVITYQMLSGRLPYGTEVFKARSKIAQRRLQYASVLHKDREIPAWVDETLKKALHPNPYKRYQELSEFIYDLYHPNDTFLNKTRAPFIEKKPVLFWKSISIILLIIIILLLMAYDECISLY